MTFQHAYNMPGRLRCRSVSVAGFIPKPGEPSHLLPDVTPCHSLRHSGANGPSSWQPYSNTGNLLFCFPQNSVCCGGSGGVSSELGTCIVSSPIFAPYALSRLLQNAKLKELELGAHAKYLKYLSRLTGLNGWGRRSICLLQNDLG